MWDDEGNLSEIHYLGVDNDKELGSTRFFYDGVSQLKQVQELDRWWGSGLWVYGEGGVKPIE